MSWRFFGVFGCVFVSIYFFLIFDVSRMMMTGRSEK